MQPNEPSRQRYLEQILNHFPDGIFTINTELQICYVNPAFCNLLGFNREELIGSQITDYLGDLNILDACMKEVSETGKCQDQETIFKRKDGSYVHISKNVQSLLDNEGNCIEILVSIRDLTQLHELNSDLNASKVTLENYTQELEQALDDLQKTQNQLIETEKMASLGSLVAGISHEINTPLGVSITSASAIHEALNKMDSKFKDGSMKRSDLENHFDYCRKSLAILNQNLARTSDLVNTFKRIAVDQSQERWQSINLKDYLTDTINSLHPKFAHRPISIHNNCDKNIYFFTDPGAIYQTFSNLIINSLNHAFSDSEAGEITINVEKINEDELHLSYHDNGIGIEPKTLAHIFEPFFTTKRGTGGTGLGLHIVYNLIHSTLNGKVSVTSRNPIGTTFVINLPIVKKEDT